MKYTANHTEILIDGLRRAQDHAGNLAEDTEQGVRERDWWDATARGLGREADRLQRDYQRDRDIELGRKFSEIKLGHSLEMPDDYWHELGVAVRLANEPTAETPF